MKQIKTLILMVFAFGLASCASTVPDYYEGLNSKILSGKAGGVVGSYKISGSRVQGIGKPMLSRATLRVKNITSGDDLSFILSNSPRVFSLRPGTYKVKSGGVSGPNVRGNMPMIALWADEFEVRAGEVVNLGEISVNRITHNVKTDGVGKVFNAITSLGTNLNDDQTYVTYEINPMSAKTEAKAFKKLPALKSKIVYRPLKMRFSEAEFRDAINDASSETEDGKLPSREKVQLELTKSLLNMAQSRRIG